MATAITNFYPEVKSAAPKCPEYVIKDFVLRTLQHFCMETRIWYDNCTNLNIVSGISFYTVTPPANTLAFELRNVQTSTIRYLTGWQYDQPTFLLNDIPTSNFTMLISAYIMPTLTATTIKDEIYYKYIDEIINGTIARLLDMPGREWSNPELAIEYKKRYVIGINRAMTRSVDKSSYPEIKVYIPACPEMYLQKVYLEKWQEFLIRTRAWYDNCTDVDVVADTSEYTVIPPTRTVAFQLRTVQEAIDDDDDNNVDYEDYTYKESILITNEIPDDDFTLEITAYLYPTISIDDIPDTIYNNHYKAICKGAAAELMKNPSSSWGNPQIALILERDYMQELHTACVKYRTDYGQQVIARKNKYFF